MTSNMLSPRRWTRARRDWETPQLRADHGCRSPVFESDSVFLPLRVQQVHRLAAAFTIRFHLAHRAFAEMRLMPAVALERGWIQTQSHTQEYAVRPVLAPSPERALETPADG